MQHLSPMMTGASALSMDALKQLAPSIFAQAPHARCSERYTYIPTINIVEKMAEAGFQVYRAGQSSSRDATRQGYTRHMIRFRHTSNLETWAKRTLNQAIPEIVLINSHDRTSGYQMMGGLFRLICLNGMIVPESRCETINFPHKGKIEQEIIEGSYRVLESVEKSVEVFERWREIKLNERERLLFAEAAHEIRFPRDEETKQPSTAIAPHQLLAEHRYEDNGHDLWTTFNVIQENCIKGGLTARVRDTSTRRGSRRTTTREINGISQDIKLNRALWTLAEKMAELKS